MQGRTADEIIKTVTGISGYEENFFESETLSKELCEDLMKDVVAINSGDDQAEKDKLLYSNCTEILAMMLTAYDD